MAPAVLSRGVAALSVVLMDIIISLISIVLCRYSFGGIEEHKRNITN